MVQSETKAVPKSVYVREKIHTLGELGIELSGKQIEHMKSLDNEIQIDNFAHDLIMAKKY